MMEINCGQLKSSLKSFIDSSGVADNVIRKYIEIDSYSEKDVKGVFSYLSAKLLEDDYTNLIADNFSQYLLLLISISYSKNEKLENFELYRKKSLVLSKLVGRSNEILRFAMQYFQGKPPPFMNPFKENEPPKKKQTSSYQIDDLDIVKCCFMLLSGSPSFFSSIWDWSSFYELYFQHGSDLQKLYSNHIVGILTNMSESEIQQLNRGLALHSLIEFDDAFSKVFKHTYSKSCDGNAKSSETVVWKTADLPIVNVEGVFLPVHNQDYSKIYQEKAVHEELVRVDSTKINLRNIAVGIVSGKPICLYGPVGCGKTTLVEFLAKLTGRMMPDKEKSKDALNEGFLRIQLGDQTDSKMLLGQYRCTDVPGEFVWLPGPLTQAVMNGQWLLLEDLDLATQDTCTILSNLLEKNYLSVAGFRDRLKVEPGFQLFVTVRTRKSSNLSQKSVYGLLQKYLHNINVLPLSRNELCEIISENYPKLKTIAPKIVDVYLTFSSGDHDTSKTVTDHEYSVLETAQNFAAHVSSSGRLISTRDLMKLCARSNPTFSVTSTECAYFVFQNAVDVFCSYVPYSQKKVKLMTSIGAKLGIIQSRCEYLSNTYKPDLNLQTDKMVIGRAHVLNIVRTNDDLGTQDGALQPKKKQKLNSGNQKDVMGSSKTQQKTVFSFTRLASCLLERIAVSVLHNEPVLLVGETGVGKTSSVQYLANITGHKLVVLNMNNQSDISDLIGGYKPVDLKYVMSPLRSEFEILFRNTFNEMKNEQFLTNISVCFNRGEYHVLVKVMTKVTSMVFDHEKNNTRNLRERKSLIKQWKDLQAKVFKYDNLLKNSMNVSFAFICGSLINSIKNGDWVLLDEINLASAETLECLSTILEPNGSLVLLEKGDLAPVPRHPDFQIFACMNPNTDIGKKDLPTGIRNRFTEFFVDELTTESDLMILVADYLANTGIKKTKVLEIVKLYKKLRSLSELELNDGLGNRPVYSLRTLCRALMITARNLCGSIERNLYESFCLSFLTQLDPVSHKVVLSIIDKAMLSNSKAILSQSIPRPSGDYIDFEGYWIQKGRKEVDDCKEYILTESVKKNLKDLARIISIGKLPVLLQGPTSAGKTSLIMYIARRSGNYCVRINNHEHTDIQEYVGTYTADAEGKLSFKEGILVQAMRKGFWIILDELNLASTEILEALNRVLDDNRELFIPETQTLIKAHKNFMLFATQNPPGLYGGRKTLSRAFRNRFVELHFSEIPKPELEIILEKRCFIPKSYAGKMVNVMSDLQVNRRSTSKNTFTLRDLFRWGNRYTYADTNLQKDTLYDWNQHLVDEGYLVLSAKVRTPVETEVIEQALFKNFRKKIDLKKLYTLSETTSMVTKEIIESLINHTIRNDIVWTQNMTRTAVLTAKALQFNEPVLLVGPTGCGKTTICQILAEIKKTKLRILNCHMHSEGADFLGGLRPCRSLESSEKKLFEWADGPLIQCMLDGSYFMADEISLAEDSVLERLNSVLETDRIIILAEKGGVNGDIDLSNLSASDEFVIHAKSGFQFLATMNPGGDFGKKELSPALRNRFTEVWCRPSDTEEDLIDISANFLKVGFVNEPQHKFHDIAAVLIRTILRIQNVVDKFKFSVRDVVTWADYLVSNMGDSGLTFPEALIYGLQTTFLDSLEMIPQENVEGIDTLRQSIINYAMQQVNKLMGYNLEPSDFHQERVMDITVTNDHFGVRPFLMTKISRESNLVDFYFDAPTTKRNLFRLLSALSLRKAILLEGPPGVGKTSVVENLAKALGYKIVRINLSEHTDLTDLFGTDLPAEDETLEICSSNKMEGEKVKAGSFAWRDGPLLAALKTENTWILLDEMNLAPQSVLEGLNAILDHRHEVFIPELNKTFQLHEKTRLFACQNPLRQGGGRKGLPQSFLNRFTKVYLRKLTTEDLLYVVSKKYKKLFETWREYFANTLKSYTCNVESVNLFKVLKMQDQFEVCESNAQNWSLECDLPQRLVDFSQKLNTAITNLEFGYKGGPYEVNLRDILRWCELLENENTGFIVADVCDKDKTMKTFQKIFNDFLQILYERMKVVYYNRMRCENDKKFINQTFGEVFDCDTEVLHKNSEDIGLYWTEDNLYLNDIVLSRKNLEDGEAEIGTLKRNDLSSEAFSSAPIILGSQREVLKNMIECLYIEKPIILSGTTDCGKSKIIDTLCTVSNKFYDNDIIDDSVTGNFLQVDLNRHLEEVLINIDYLLKDNLRKVILKVQALNLEDHRKANMYVMELLRLWAECTNAYVNQDSSSITTMSEELELFKKRLYSLENVIKRMQHHKVTTDKNSLLQSVEKVLQNLKKIVQNSKTLNSGGQFEWVDSKIVKCIKNGNYICLDHVNLCSSAVLDRLNSVFEPKGTLLLSEKGITGDDKENVIEKHKNFRAFLMLDPRNGELSRAMRNRCIEISLSSDSYTDKDLRQIIFINGVTDCNTVTKVLNIHNRMKSVCEYTPFSIMNLIHFAFLVNSNKKLGLSSSDAIFTSAMDVYVYSSSIDLLGHGLDYYRSRLKQIIEEENSYTDTLFEEECAFENTIVYSSNLSSLSMIKLQSEPLKILLQSYPDQNKAIRNLSFVAPQYKGSLLNYLDTIRLYIFILYECSTFEDISIRKQYFSALIHQSTGIDNVERLQLIQLNEKLSQNVSEMEQCFAKRTPFIPWNSKLFSRIRDYKAMNIKELSIMNFSALLMCDTLIENLKPKGVNKFNKMSILDYSAAVSNKQISNTFNNNILENCYHVLNDLKKKVILCLSNAEMEVDHYVDMIVSFLWLNRVYKTSLANVSVNKTLNVSAIDNLSLHFKWLFKKCLQLIKNFSDCLAKDEKFKKSFETISDYIKKIIDQPISILQKTFWKNSLDFRPLFEQQQIEMQVLRSKYDTLLRFVPLYGTLDFECLERKLLTMWSNESFEVRNILATEFEDANLLDLDPSVISDDANSKCTQLQVILDQLKERIVTYNMNCVRTERSAYLEDAKIFMERMNKTYSTDLEDKMKQPEDCLELCCLKEYYSDKVLQALALCNARSIRYNLSYFKLIPTLSSSALSLVHFLSNEKYKFIEEFWASAMEILNQNNINDFVMVFGKSNYKTVSTFFRILNCYYQQYHSRNVAANNRVCFALANKTDFNPELIYDGPVLTNIVLQLLLQFNGNLRPIELGKIDSWRRTLNQANQLLWTNLHLTSSSNSAGMVQLNSSLVHSKKLLLDLCNLKETLSNSKAFDLNSCKQFWNLADELSKKREIAEKYVVEKENLFMNSFLMDYHSSTINSLMGAIELTLFTYTPLIDPVEKQNFKNEYISEDIKLLEDLLLVYGLMKSILNYENYGQEIYNEIEMKTSALRSIQKKFSHKVALRPEANLYRNLAQDVCHFFHTNCNPEHLFEIISDVDRLFSQAMEGDNFKSLMIEDESYLCDISETVSKLNFWIENSKKFNHHTLQKYAHYYRDFLLPIECAVTMMQFGFEGLKKSLVIIRNSLQSVPSGEFYNMNSNEKLSTAMQCIARYPSSNNLYMCRQPKAHKSCDNLLYMLLNSTESPDFEKFLLLKAKWLEVKNMITLTRFLDHETFSEFDHTVKMFVNLWEQEEEQRQKRKVEEESLYVTKQHSEPTEEELELEEIEQQFPTSFVNEFDQFVEQETLDKIKKPKLTKKDSKWELLNEDEIDNYVKNFIKTIETWTTVYYYKPSDSAQKAEQVHFIESFELRFKVFSKIFETHKSAINECADITLYNSFLFLIGLQQAKINEVRIEEAESKSCNFYKDSNVSEVVTCIDTLKKVRQRVSAQLELYPDHAVLNDIIKVINKIESLPATTPVIQFNVGFQMLRQKISQWNEVAHKNNNFIDLEVSVAEYVQKWTKLELTHWRNCLSETYEKAQKPAYKYWFFLYEVFEEYLTTVPIAENLENGIEDNIKPSKDVEKGCMRSNDVIKVLKEFVEVSSYADFAIRLKLLKSFELYLHFKTYDKAIKRKAKLISIIHNLHLYYEQFINEVEDHVKAVKIPIEKKLKELVKIESYNKDLSYFSMRNNVARVHRNLNKFLKEFASSVKERITKIFELKEQPSRDFNLDNDKGVNLRYEAKIKYYMLDVKHFIAPQKLKTHFDRELENTSHLALLQKAEKYFVTSRNVVKQMISNAEYPKLIHSLDILVGEQIDYCDHLRKLEVDRSQEKPKQKAQAKHILTQKKKALSDLFKNLQKLGMSFKAGLAEFRLKENLISYDIPPFCLKNMFNLSKYKKLDQNLIHLSENLNNYYAKCCFKISLLKKLILSPKVDLGIINYERIKGFSVDMFLFVEDQRKSVGKAIKDLYELRNAINDISTLLNCLENTEGNNLDTLNFSALEERKREVCICSSKIRHVLEQFSLLLKCVPLDGSSENIAENVDSELNLQQINPKYIQIVEQTNKILASSAKLSSDISCANGDEFLNSSLVKSYMERLQDIVKHLESLRDEFMLESNEYMLVAQPIIDVIEEVQNEMDKNVTSSCTTEIDEDKINDEIESLMHNMLIGFQNVYKKYPNCDKNESGNSDQQSDEHEYEILDDHLKQKVNNELISDLNTLGISNILKKLSKILLTIKIGKNVDAKKTCIEKLAFVLPIIEQYNLLGDYLLIQLLGAHKISTKMLSILLTVFVELSVKGFCIPPDLLQDEEGEPKKQKSGGGGMGFEDGTGENDISDKIESEDQLDDAKKPEDRQKEDEKNDEDCKEEKGIDMSEDFDAKMQDIEKGNDSDESQDSEDEEEEVDKQMGDAEDGEKLDDQIWGSDDEEKNSEDEEDLNEEENAKGSKDENDQHNDLNNKDDKKKGDEKDDGLEATNDDENKSKKEKEKDIDHMQEPEVDEDQVNPYHNELEEPPEPEDLNLENNIDIDEDNCKEQDESENNPFDIDTMKENMDEPDDMEKDDDANEQENEKKDESASDGSDSEDEEQVGESAKENKTQDKGDEEGIEEENSPEDEAKEEDKSEKDANELENDEDKQEDCKQDEQNNENEEPDNDAEQQEVHEIDRNATKEEVEAAPDDSKQASNDNAITNSEKESNLDKPEKTDKQDTGDEKEGTGVAQNDISEEGHKGLANEDEKQNFDNSAKENNMSDRKKQGKANEERTLGDPNESQIKQLKTVDKMDEKTREEDKEPTESNNANEYQHVKEAQKDDVTIIDTATEEQSKKIEPVKDIENEEENMESNPDEILGDEDLNDEEMQNAENIESERTDQKSDKPAKNDKTNEKCETVERMEIEGEDADTFTVPRGNETTAHYSKEILNISGYNEEVNVAEALAHRKLYENQVNEAKVFPGQDDYTVWKDVCNKMMSNARDLCEQLRLILEPTKCTRLKGDYRTGRRINMRKIIPYIASQFRKDKIWLRRTKPSQRDYKITIAIDDSKSMHHNNSKTLTLEAISLVSQALNLLESGKLSVVSFGESPQIVLNHTEQFDGPRLVKQLNFEQNQSNVAEMLNFIRNIDAEDKSSTTNDLFENLILILSDGRNIFAEGEQKVKQAVKLARLQRIFLVYIIIDNPENKHSILDIRVPHFSTDKKSIDMRSYLDVFPFPYYVIVRDLTQLPLVLSEAMRQWFELVNSE